MNFDLSLIDPSSLSLSLRENRENRKHRETRFATTKFKPEVRIYLRFLYE